MTFKDFIYNMSKKFTQKLENKKFRELVQRKLLDN
jgi:hypothetical protein